MTSNDTTLDAEGFERARRLVEAIMSQDQNFRVRALTALRRAMYKDPADLDMLEVMVSVASAESILEMQRIVNKVRVLKKWTVYETGYARRFHDSNALGAQVLIQGDSLVSYILGKRTGERYYPQDAAAFRATAMLEMRTAIDSQFKMSNGAFRLIGNSNDIEEG